MQHVYYYVDLGEVMEFHKSLHEEEVSIEADFSLDGVPESKNSGRSVDILSVQFLGCKNVYTIAILQPLGDDPVDTEEILANFLQDVPGTRFQLRRGISDAPMRSKLRCTMRFNAIYGCDYCFAPKVKQKYPASTQNAAPRTHDNHMEIVRMIESEGGVYTDYDAKVVLGVKSRSPLIDAFPNFNIIDDIPAEKMHLVDLGLIRKLVGMTFFQNTPKGDLKFRRTKMFVLNAELRKIKSITDFSRRIRDCDLGIWKAQEYRNMVLCLWPAVVKTCASECKHVWLLTVFLVRATCLPDDIYQRIKTAVNLKELLEQWYIKYQNVYTTSNCVYTIHMFSHLLRIRELGPLTDNSATRFEDHYAFLKRNYHAGTDSTGLQAIRNSYLAIKSGHKCKKYMRISARETSKIDDRYVFTKNESIVRLQSVENGTAVGHVMKTELGYYAIPGLNFNEVLVYKLAKNQRKLQKVELNTSEIIGKCILVDDVVSVAT